MKYREIPDMSEEQIKDFWSKIRKTETCWIWSSYTNKAGYGVYGMNKTRYIVPRVMYFIQHGDVNPYLMVCHKCNNPICCNPDHLYLDVASGNTQYSYDSGRKPLIGVEHGMSKLTSTDVKLLNKDR